MPPPLGASCGPLCSSTSVPLHPRLHSFIHKQRWRDARGSHWHAMVETRVMLWPAAPDPRPRRGCNTLFSLLLRPHAESRTIHSSLTQLHPRSLSHNRWCASMSWPCWLPSWGPQKWAAEPHSLLLRRGGLTCSALSAHPFRLCLDVTTHLLCEAMPWLSRLAVASSTISSVR